MPSIFSGNWIIVTQYEFAKLMNSVVGLGSVGFLHGTIPSSGKVLPHHHVFHQEALSLSYIP